MEEEEDEFVNQQRTAGLAASAQKTPISLLQELCARHGLTPDYKLLSVEGVVHAPTFMYRVEVGDVVATATGQSKKKAKHSAAKTVLEKLLANGGIFANTTIEDGTTITESNFTSVITEPTNRTSPTDDGVPGNPVGALQELCMKKRWRPPYYETISVLGLPHERTFGITCSVKNYNKTGIGKSKRMAKRQAAHLMITELEDQMEKGDDTDGFTDLGKDSINPGESGEKSRGFEPYSRSGQAIPNHSGTVSKFIEKMSQSTTLSFNEDSDPSEKDIEFLEEIGKEHDFIVLYISLPKGRSGKHYCLVQLGSVPVAVCYGSGMDPQEAQQMAAHSALQFLRLVARKS